MPSKDRTAATPPSTTPDYNSTFAKISMDVPLSERAHVPGTLSLERTSPVALGSVPFKKGYTPTRMSRRLAQKAAFKSSREQGQAVGPSMTVSKSRKMTKGPMMEVRQTARSVAATNVSNPKTSEADGCGESRPPRNLCRSATALTLELNHNL